MCDVRVDHLVLENQLRASSLGKTTISPTLSVPQLTVALCLQLRLHELFHFEVSMSIGVVIV